MPAPLPTVCLEGRVVRLEPLTMGHAAALARASAEDRSNYQWTWVPDGVAETHGYITTALAQRSAGLSLPFATIERASNRPIGSTRFLTVQYWAWPEGNANQRGEAAPDAVEIGSTWLAASAQRTALNTEAKLLMLRHAFEAWRVHRVTFRTDARNERSRAAIERLGATLDGVLRAWEPGSDGAVRDTAYYSIVEAEWPRVEARLAARAAQ